MDKEKENKCPENKKLSTQKNEYQLKGIQNYSTNSYTPWLWCLYEPKSKLEVSTRY